MKQRYIEKIAELKTKLTTDELSIVQDLLSDQESEWQKRLNKIPVLAPLLGTFGLVATLYGFEKLIDQTILIQYPTVLLVTGVLVMLFTGVFYRKL